MAVQLRLGLLSKWGLGADPFDRADSVAAGAHLTPQLATASDPFGSNHLFLAASRRSRTTERNGSLDTAEVHMRSEQSFVP